MMRLIEAAAIAAALLPAPVLAQERVPPIADEAGTALLEIAPVRIQLIGDERGAAITVRNLDTQTVILQVRGFDWSQSDGAERFTPSTILVASPPMVALPAGEAQLIRVAINGLPATPVERAFRLVIDRIAGKPDPDARAQAAIRVQLPVFVSSAAPDRPLLRWQARRTGTGLVLTAVNASIGHDRIASLQVSTEAGAIGETLDGYVLGQASRSWTIANVPASARLVRIRGEGDYGAIEAEVAIAP